MHPWSNMTKEEFHKKKRLLHRSMLGASLILVSMFGIQVYASMTRPHQQKPQDNGIDTDFSELIQQAGDLKNEIEDVLNSKNEQQEQLNIDAINKIKENIGNENQNTEQEQDTGQEQSIEQESPLEPEPDQETEPKQKVKTNTLNTSDTGDWNFKEEETQEQ